MFLKSFIPNQVLIVCYKEDIHVHSLIRAIIAFCFSQDVNATDNMGWTAAHCAAFHGRLGCLQVMTSFYLKTRKNRQTDRWMTENRSAGQTDR
jgi:hypothetical protein